MRKGVVKNKAAAAVQVTAEQILRVAHDLRERPEETVRETIQDGEEYGEYQQRRRRAFEASVRGRGSKAAYFRYAEWEERCGELARARNVYERALQADYRDVPTWLRYADFELRHKHVQLARNVLERATTLLPRVATLWYKAIEMETALQRPEQARALFERWLQLGGADDAAYAAYARFEERQCRDWERAVDISRRAAHDLPSVVTYQRWAHLEERLGHVEAARSVWEESLAALQAFAVEEALLREFAQFEVRCGEPARARAIFRFALDHLPWGAAQTLYAEYIRFEKRHGTTEALDEAVLAKRRFQYEAALSESPNDYDTWFDYLRLLGGAPPAQSPVELSAERIEAIRDAYERAVAQIPPSNSDKSLWRRYLYVWLEYALFEELAVCAVDRAREVLTMALRVVPHRAFTFAKLWIALASLEIRDGRLDEARRVLGRGIGVSGGKRKIMRFYVDLELRLGRVDACRTLHQRAVELHPGDPRSWLDCALFEAEQLDEWPRARAILEMALASSDELARDETLWRGYLDLERAGGDEHAVRALYGRLVGISDRPARVWISWALYERGLGAQDPEPARRVFEKGLTALKENREERVALFQAYRALEAEVGSDESRAALEKRRPNRVRRTRPLPSGEGLEEYWDYVFPDEDSQPSLARILERARLWKKDSSAPVKSENDKADNDAASPSFWNDPSEKSL